MYIKQKRKSKKTNAYNIIMVLILILAIALCIGIWYWYDKKIMNLPSSLGYLNLNNKNKTVIIKTIADITRLLSYMYFKT